jgi:UDP-N-acetylmuramate dehydrogenase
MSTLSDPRVKTLPKLPLGGGSNTLFTGDYKGLVIRMDLPGIDVVREESDNVWIKCGAGVVWHDFVQYCIAHQLSGAENLSLIPGSVGAAPMQNIGAYGVELKDIFWELEAWLPEDRKTVCFNNAECQFGYRSSIFKTALKNKSYILNATFKLSKNFTPDTRYGAIATQLDEMGVTYPTLKEVSDAIIAIRRAKLPDPTVIGNAGSFFKNPVIAKDIFLRLQKNYPDIPSWSAGEKAVKVPAGWLIEKAGWKGKTFFGKYGVHARQALVLVNYGGATGNEILQLSDTIIRDIEEKFGIALEREVNIL